MINITPRMKRLEEDYRRMQELRSKSTLINFQAFGHPPEKYIVTFTCKGVKLDTVMKSVISTYHHEVEIYLTSGYPRIQPKLEWLTPIFHPNIGTNGNVCLGGWSPAESLDRLCIRLGEMIQYKNYDEFDPLNEAASAWALQNKNKLPVDTQPLESNDVGKSLGYTVKFSM